ALQARGPPAGDLSRAERELPPEEQPVELVELAAPVARRPGRDAARSAEVAVVVRPHLVPLAVAERDLAAHRRDPGGVRREADRRVTARLFWGRVLVVVRPVEQVGTTHEEREVRVCLPRDAAPVLPQTRAARAVE